MLHQQPKKKRGAKERLGSGEVQLSARLAWFLAGGQGGEAMQIQMDPHSPELWVCEETMMRYLMLEKTGMDG